MFRSKQNKTELDILEEKYEKHLKAVPDSSSFVLLAEVLLKKNNIERAISILLRGLRNNKNMVTARFLLGKAYYQCWKIDLALKELKKTIELAPDNFAAAELLIEIYKSEKRYEDAFKTANSIIFYYKDNQKLEKEIKELADLINIENKRSSDRTLSSFRFSVSKKTKTNRNYLKTETLADIYISQNEYDEALKIMEELIIKEPQNLDYREKYHRVMHLLSRKSIR